MSGQYKVAWLCETLLPALAKGLGESVKEFKKAAKDTDDATKAADDKKPDSHGKN